MDLARFNSRILERGLQYALLMRLHRPIGIFLLLWPTLWSLWIAAGGVPDGYVLFVFIAGVIIMRSAGCVINDFADRDIDPHVSRTQLRPLAAGRVTTNEALILFMILCLLAFALVMTLNRLTIQLSVVAVILAAVYPFVKRFTYLPQIFLGMAFAWSVPMAFAAQTGAVPQVAWLLFIATVLWATAYDTMYAMVDREDDLKIGVKSTAILFGDADKAIIGLIQVLLLVVLWLVGNKLGLGWPYYLAWLAAGCFSIYQQLLIQDRVPSRCFRAFLNNNWLGGTVFFGIALNYLSL